MLHFNTVLGVFSLPIYASRKITKMVRISDMEPDQGPVSLGFYIYFFISLDIVTPLPESAF